MLIYVYLLLWSYVSQNIFGNRKTVMNMKSRKDGFRQYDKEKVERFSVYRLQAFFNLSFLNLNCISLLYSLTTLRRLLTCCVLRSTQPPTLAGTGNK